MADVTPPTIRTFQVYPDVPEALRRRFQTHGIALTAYPAGVIRLSAPPQPLSDTALHHLQTALCDRA